MKKPNLARQRWVTRLAQRERRRCRRQAGAQRRRRQVVKKTPHDLLEAPERLMLFSINHRRYEGTMAFLEFIERLRDYRGRALKIDLRRVRSLHAAATLLFKAELCYLQRRGVLLEAIAPRRSRAQQVLRQTGLAELLRLQIDTVVDRADVVHWRHTSGRHDMADPELLGEMLQDVENPIDSPLFVGTVESVANCVEHAYKQHRTRRAMHPMQDGWWAFQQVRDGTISVCVCDLGIGVANALPIRLQDEPNLFKRLMSMMATYKGRDCRAIRAALEYGRTGTGQRHRGKGLRDATKVIDSAGAGSFMLLSNKGMYSYVRRNPQQRAMEHTRPLDKSIRGTIYMWTYSLQSVKHDLAISQEAQ